MSYKSIRLDSPPLKGWVTIFGVVLLPVFLTLSACDQRSDANFQYLIGTWEQEWISREDGQRLGMFYRVYERPNTEGIGREYQLVPDRPGSSESSVFLNWYRIVSTTRNGQQVRFERDAAAGWVPITFEIVDSNNNQALFKERAVGDSSVFNRVFGRADVDRVSAAIQEAISSGSVVEYRSHARKGHYRTPMAFRVIDRLGFADLQYNGMHDSSNQPDDDF